ncbi:MAG: hypothetical protein ACM3KL_06775 [Alphaproteobacteria bacterium]
MKKVFVLFLLIPFTLVCSCQKQDTAAEEQLAKRKAELDAREKALDEREKALVEREKSPAMRPVARVPRVRPAEAQRSVPPELQGLIADPSGARAERERLMKDRLAERQRRMEELHKARAARALPRPQATAPVTEAASPSPSATAE